MDDMMTSIYCSLEELCLQSSSFYVSNIIYRVKYLYIDDFRKVGILIDALRLHSLGIQ